MGQTGAKKHRPLKGSRLPRLSSPAKGFAFCKDQPAAIRTMRTTTHGSEYGASGIEICWKVGLARAAAHEHRLYVLCVIAWRLNGKGGPKRIGRRRQIARVRFRNEFTACQTELAGGARPSVITAFAATQAYTLISNPMSASDARTPPLIPQ